MSTARPAGSCLNSSSREPASTSRASRKCGRRNQVRKGRGITRIAAAADAGGCGGVELWINSELQIDPESIFVLHASPKLLVLTLVWQTQLTCFAVMHGLDAAYGAEAVPLWWASATLRQLRPAGCPLFILADTNAKVGSVQTPFVGGHQADQETTAGELLHELLAELDFAIPATFAATGEGWTWQSNSGRRHRIDYVICPVT